MFLDTNTIIYLIYGKFSLVVLKNSVGFITILSIE